MSSFANNKGDEKKSNINEDKKNQDNNENNSNNDCITKIIKEPNKNIAKKEFNSSDQIMSVNKFKYFQNFRNKDNEDNNKIFEIMSNDVCEKM
jgi:hypothetical protein